MKYTALLPLIAAALAGCAAGSLRPTPVGSAGMPYDGLNADSYGPRASTPLRYCDPQQDSASQQALTPGNSVNDVAHGIAAAATKFVGQPLQGLMKIDDSLQSLGLSERFQIPADSGYPPVAVLSHGAQGIVFWHASQMVKLPEVSDAAQTFCAQRQRNAVYRGSASRCPPAERGIGGTAVLPTFTISAFACSGR